MMTMKNKKSKIKDCTKFLEMKHSTTKFSIEHYKLFWDRWMIRFEITPTYQIKSCCTQGHFFIYNSKYVKGKGLVGRFISMANLFFLDF